MNQQVEIDKLRKVGITYDEKTIDTKKKQKLNKCSVFKLFNIFMFSFSTSYFFGLSIFPQYTNISLLFVLCFGSLIVSSNNIIRDENKFVDYLMFFVTLIINLIIMGAFMVGFLSGLGII